MKKYAGIPLWGLLSFLSLSQAAMAANPPRTLGQPTVIRSNYKCDKGNRCYDLKITCPNVSMPIYATVYFKQPRANQIGTITFHSGSSGTDLWSSASDYASKAVRDLNELGYQTIQIKWESNWSVGSGALKEGVGALACRPATAIQWIYDHLHVNKSQPFCSTGNSAGSTQILYSVSEYGLDGIYDGIIASSGPETADLQAGCYETVNSPLYLIGQVGAIDATYGFAKNKGPCTMRDQTYSSKFFNDSLALGEWTYRFPKTMVWLITGALDTETATIAQSGLYYQRLLLSGTPYLNSQQLPNSGHEVHDTQEGVNAIKSALIGECRVHSPVY